MWDCTRYNTIYKGNWTVLDIYVLDIYVLDICTRYICTRYMY